ncbi:MULTISPECIES: TolC family protein [unclassified Pseudoalteromonas]|uniref:TolC family protein n=1 Tax=unclassified Pseudoalteromonas TaxID=194690 RepID=UPI0030151042
MLLELYRKGAKNSLFVHAEQSAYLAEVEGERQSFAQLLPELKLTANVNHNRLENESPSSNLLHYELKQLSATESRQLELSLNQRIFDLPTYYSYRASQDIAIRAKVRFHRALSNYTKDFLSAYFEVAKARERLLFIQDTLDAYESQNSIIKSRYTLGLVKVSELKGAESQQLKVKADEVIAKNELHTAFERLSLITQVEVSAIQKLSGEVPVLHNSNRDVSSLQQRFKGNLDYKLAVLDLSAASKKWQAEKSRHLPTVTGRISYTESRADNTYNYKAVNSLERQGWNAGVYLEMPLYSGGATTSASTAAQLLVKQKRALKKLKAHEVKQQISHSFLTLNAMHRSIMANSEAVKAADLALKSAADEYFNGVGPFSRVLDNREKLLSEKLSLIQQKYDYMTRFALLKELMGELSAEEVKGFGRLFNGALVHKNNGN